MKDNKFLKHTLFIDSAVPLVVMGLIFCLAWPAYRQIFAQDINLTEYLASNSVEVGSETVNGYQQVYYIWNGEKVFVTDGSLNSSEAVSDGEYIVFTKTIDGAGQIFLHHIPSDTTKQITNTGTNLQPRLSNGKVVWEGWVVNNWQIFLYDGVSVSQITTGNLSIHPDILDDRIIYESNNKQGEWSTFEYTLGSKKATVLNRGSTASRSKFMDGEIVYDLKGTFDKQKSGEQAVRDATRLAGETSRIALDTKLALDALLVGTTFEEPVPEEELVPEPEIVPEIIEPQPSPVLEACVEDLPETNVESPFITDNLPATTTDDFSTTTAPVTGATPIHKCALLHVIKLVVNASGGVASSTDFNIHLQMAGVDVSGSPSVGVMPPGNLYSLSPGAYAVSEDPVVEYEQIFSGDCDTNGSITLLAGEEKFCTIVNTDIPPPTEEPPAEEVIRVLPVIDVLMHDEPRETPELPYAPHLFTHSYTISMLSGEVSLIDLDVTDDSCTPLEFLSGDTNADGKLDLGENWLYQCSVFISETITNTVTVVGYTDDELHEATIATSVNTIVVVEPLAPGLPETGFITDLFRNRNAPRINIIKVPDILPDAPDGASNVSYKYVVTNPGSISLSDVEVLDNTCSPVVLMISEETKGGLLLPDDSWIYTCRTSVPETTRNVTMVIGKANGQIAVGYAFSSILVYSSSYYNKAILILLSILLLSVAIYIVYKRKNSARITDGEVTN